MRRSRPNDLLGNRMSSMQERQTPSTTHPPSADSMVLDWGLLSAAAGPSTAVASSVCCLCGEPNDDVPAPDDLKSNISSGGGGGSGRNPETSGSLSKACRQRGGGRGVGGGPGGADESFVVLPADSTPVLSESYFSLSRNGVPAEIIDDPPYARGEMSSQPSEGGPLDSREISSASIPSGSSRLTVDGGSLPRYGVMSIIGEASTAGWTGAGFGTGSATMLESIVQISHAGLSDNVRRECLLHDLSKEMPDRLLEDDGGRGGFEGGADANDLQENRQLYPSLCWHCWGSLLDRIDEDSRLADSEALAYRDFIELLDGIADDDVDTSSWSFGNKGAQTDAGEERLIEQEAISGDTAGWSAPADRMVYSDHSTRSTFAKALEMSQQTSAQLRAELRSLEEQLRAVRVRGSKAWEALSELAWARRVLGEDCRELLRVSRELAEKAAALSERPALSEMFTVQVGSGFPRINGHRLNWTPDDKLQLHWSEINAAWGEAVLLVRCVANAINFRSRRFRLVPMNCASRVIELAVGEGADSSDAAAPVVCAHDLFSAGGRNDHNRRRIVAAVRAFAACSAEMITELEKLVLERRLNAGQDSDAAAPDCIGARSPFKQMGDSIDGVPLAFFRSQNSWRVWLCRFVKNLDWAVAAASSLYVS